MTSSDGATTVLPYWPPAPPAPVIVFDNNGVGNPQAVDFSANCTGTTYLTNDFVTPSLDANGTTLIGETRTPPGNEAWYFDGLKRQPDRFRTRCRI